jgi:LysM repeat protein
MSKAVLLIGSILLLAVGAKPLLAQGAYGPELANLREDVRALTKTVGELHLRLEQLERENGDLRAKNQGANKSYATVAQLNEAVADLNKLIKSSNAASQKDTLHQVSLQIEKLVKQTNANMEALAKSVGGRAAGGVSGGGGTGEKAASSPVTAPITFSDDFPKDSGVKYTVVKGDNLPGIAKKTGGKERDIRNANKIADPSKLQVGQVLWIPLDKKE